MTSPFNWRSAHKGDHSTWDAHTRGTCSRWRQWNGISCSEMHFSLLLFQMKKSWPWRIPLNDENHPWFGNIALLIWKQCSFHAFRSGHVISRERFICGSIHTSSRDNFPFRVQHRFNQSRFDYPANLMLTVHPVSLAVISQLFGSHHRMEVGLTTGYEFMFYRHSKLSYRVVLRIWLAPNVLAYTRLFAMLNSLFATRILSLTDWCEKIHHTQTGV